MLGDASRMSAGTTVRVGVKSQLGTTSTGMKGVGRFFAGKSLKSRCAGY